PAQGDRAALEERGLRGRRGVDRPRLVRARRGHEAPARTGPLLRVVGHVVNLYGRDLQVVRLGVAAAEVRAIHVHAPGSYGRADDGQRHDPLLRGTDVLVLETHTSAVEVPPGQGEVAFDVGRAGAGVILDPGLPDDRVVPRTQVEVDQRRFPACAV